MNDAQDQTKPVADESGPDAALVEKALAGEERSFEALLSPVYSNLREYVHGALRGSPRADPDEIMAEVIRRAWLNLHRFIPIYTFRSYIFGIAKMSILRACRRKPARETTLTDLSVEDLDSGEAVQPEPALLPQDHSARGFALSGIVRLPRPDQRVHSSSILREMIIAMLAYGGYPHQQVAFGFSVAMWGEAKKEAKARSGSVGKPLSSGRSKVPVTGDPDQVVERLADELLTESARSLREFFEIEAQVADDDLDRAFYPFLYRLSLIGSGLFSKDVASARLFGHLERERISETSLRQYFGKNPRKSVADWTDGVKTNTAKALAGTFDTRRSPLPFPPDWPR